MRRLKPCSQVFYTRTYVADYGLNRSFIFYSLAELLPAALREANRQKTHEEIQALRKDRDVRLMDSRLKPPLLLDGATGTNLIAAGMPQGVCVEQWVLDNPQVILQLQKQFVEAGSDIIYAPTFSANAVKMKHYGLEGQLKELNASLVALSKQAAGDRALVAGDMSPTGQFCEPFGDMKFMDLVGVYAEQALYLKAAGADLIVIETMMSLLETRAAVLGARQAGLPIFATMTIGPGGRTISGTDILAALITLQGLGVSAFGLNCSEGPHSLAEQIARIAPYAQIPLIAKPNAGVPDENHPGGFTMSPEEMAEEMKELLQAGATIIGGCCGTTPAHLAAIRSMLDGYDFGGAATPKEPDEMIAANESQVFFMDENIQFGEPLECSVDMSDELIDADEEEGDTVLIHVTSFDDAYQFSQNAHMARVPVSFISENEEALEAALMLFNGRAIIDSRSELPEETIHRLATAYGAIVI